MERENLTQYGVTLLRVSLGLMYLSHSIVLKLIDFGLNGTVKYFASIHLPGWFAYPTIAAEIVGGTMLVLGLQARWVALALTPILAAAIIWVHGANGWVFEAPGGGWEYPLYLITLSIAQFMLGDGRFAMLPSWTRATEARS